MRPVESFLSVLTLKAVRLASEPNTLSDDFKRVERQLGVLILFRTKRFQSLMDSLGRRRITKPTAWVLLFLFPIGAAIAIYLFVADLIALTSPTSGAATASYIRTLSILGNLAIPGINPYLPIADGFIALVVGIVVHEAAHGVVARSLGLPIKSSGLIFFLVIPIGAFVEVDEQALRSARARDSERVLGAGAGTNIVLALVCLLLLFGVVSGMKVSADGIGVTGVYSNSAAARAGIQPFDYITAVDGTPVNNPGQISGASWYQIGSVVNITISRDGTTRQLDGVTIGNLTQENSTSKQITYKPFIGIDVVSGADLQSTAASYSGSFFGEKLFFCIPTIPNCQSLVPFSDQLSGFYTSSLGGLTTPTANLLYWLFFLNFNLGIFNALPIYPLDGGQAFQIGLKAASRGRLTDKALGRITLIIALILVAVILTFIIGPYVLF